MSRQHLVRIGALGTVGRFSAVDSVCYPRHTRVICRTGRGLEVGEVLAPPDDTTSTARGDGSILRGMTPADELLLARLEKNRQAAFSACAARISEHHLSAVLMEVEQLFDGRSLVFYFLGELSPELEALTAELTTAYDAEAQIRQFADTLTHGCGPDCGTESATGHGCTSCATGCAIAGACGTSR